MKNKDRVNEYLNKYRYRAEWSEKDGVFIAKAIEKPSIFAHSTTPEGAIKEVKVPLINGPREYDGGR